MQSKFIIQNPLNREPTIVLEETPILFFFSSWTAAKLRATPNKPPNSFSVG